MSISEIVVADSVTLSVTDEGDGPAILFVHGLACDATDWALQLARFRSTHRVIVPELRGHGRSSVPKVGYDVDTLTADLVAVLDALDVTTSIVVGHSLGGLLAGALAIDHPERVSAVVAIDPPWGPPSGRGLYEMLLGVVSEPGGLASAFEASESSMTPGYAREAHRRGALVTDVDVLGMCWQQCFLEPGVLVFDEDRLRSRTRPMFVLHSKNHPGSAAWEATVSGHPADRALELPLGHWIHHDQPELTNELIVEWLATLDA